MFNGLVLNLFTYLRPFALVVSVVIVVFFGWNELSEITKNFGGIEQSEKPLDYSDFQIFFASHVRIWIKRERDKKKAILIKVRLILSFSLTRMTVKPQNGRGNALRFFLSERQKDVRPKQPNDELTVVRAKTKTRITLLQCNCNYFCHSELEIASFHFDNFILYEGFFSGRDDAIYFQEFQINRSGKPSFVLLLVRNLCEESMWRGFVSIPFTSGKMLKNHPVKVRTIFTDGKLCFKPIGKAKSAPRLLKYLNTKKKKLKKSISELIKRIFTGCCK